MDRTTAAIVSFCCGVIFTILLILWLVRSVSAAVGYDANKGAVRTTWPGREAAGFPGCVLPRRFSPHQSSGNRRFAILRLIMKICGTERRQAIAD